MAWTWYQKCIALLLVVTGSINTLTTKWADRTESVGVDGTSRLFDHPFLQACAMFLGEFFCLICFQIMFRIYKHKEIKTGSPLPDKVQGNQDFNPFIFYIPALCDMMGTSIMYVGLNLTYASSFQMLRGAVIIFTGFLSVAFLNRRLKIYEWIGIFIVCIGLTCVGVSDMIGKKEPHTDSNKVLTGDLLIILAQVIVAIQMVVEEKFITQHNVNPLQGVGWEGFFGFFTLSILLIPMYYIRLPKNPIFHNPSGSFEDAIDGFYQIGNSPQICVAIIGTIISIAFFNFAGLSVTKELSATTRMVLDSVRTFTVWLFCLLVRWEKFHGLQLGGFLILFIGMCLYNDVIIRPLYLRFRYGEQEETESLISSKTKEPTLPVYSDSPNLESSRGSINQ